MGVADLESRASKSRCRLEKNVRVEAAGKVAKDGDND